MIWNCVDLNIDWPVDSEYDLILTDKYRIKSLKVLLSSI